MIEQSFAVESQNVMTAAVVMPDSARAHRSITTSGAPSNTNVATPSLAIAEVG
jgi:hypothetical protein